MKQLFLLRGLPGSGKSTLAKDLSGGAGQCHFEADMFFLDDDSNYVFDASRIKQAHQWCQDQVLRAMNGDMHIIVVSNTFTQEWEMEWYFNIAEKYGYRVYSLIVENRHGGINEHGVPADKLEQMKQRFEIKL